MSLSNLSTSLSQGIGGSIYEAMAEHWGYASAFQALVTVGAICTASCWFLAPYLRRSILGSNRVARQ
jgi:predicted MFS family arabinose efflux permease